MTGGEHTPATSLRRALVVCVLGSSLAACSHTEPIYNVENRTVPVQTSNLLSSGTLADAIVRAADAQHWRLNALAPGEYRATTTWRSHSATAIIRYDTATYSISLEQSRNLRQADGQIHRAYNRRV